jgi:hypothetical protein
MGLDYGAYQESLKSSSTDYNAALAEMGGVMGQNAQNIYKEILAQQKAGSGQYWYKGNTASIEAAATDVAFRLAENGLSSLRDVGQRNVTYDTSDYEGAPTTATRSELYNKSTGELIPRPDLFGDGSGRSNLDIVYNLHFTEDGDVIPYTSNRTSGWVEFREGTLKPVAAIALAAYGVPLVSGALAGTTVAGVTLTAGSAALAGVSAGLVSGGVSILSGNSFEDALKSALVGGLTAGATAGYADTIGQTLGFDAGSVASKAAGQAIIAGAKAGITDQNVLQNMATAAVSSYMSNKDGVIKATDEDLAAGIDPRYGSNQTYDTFMSEAMRNTNTYLTENQDFATNEMGRIGQLGDAYNADNAFDATATEGSLAKPPANEGLNLTAKDIKTAVKIGGVLMAGDEVVANTIGNSGLSGRPSEPIDKYRNAPLAGFKMVKYDDPVTGSSKYIPFVGEEALLPPPAGYDRKYAKGGFVSKKKTTKSTSLVSRRK